MPAHRAVRITETSIGFNYTTVLDVVFLVLAAVLVRRFMRTGGPKMLRMMDMPPGQMNETTTMANGTMRGHGD
jgi:hypothetical protein